MSIFSAIGKAAILWHRHGDKIERTLDIWLADTPASPKPAVEVVNDVRKAVGTKPMNEAERKAFEQEQAWMNRTGR